MPSGKFTNAETFRRVDMVMSLLLKGFTRRDILKFAATNTDPPWNVKNRAIDAYISRAKKTIKKAFESRAQYFLGLGIQRLDYLYKKSMEIQNYRLALAI